MKLKTTILTIGFAVLIYDSLLADAFPKSSESLGGPVVSLEVLGSFEMRFKSNFGLTVWGGMATIFSPFYFGGGRPLFPYLTFGYRFVFEKKKK